MGLCRTVSDAKKQQISDKMKNVWAKRSEIERERIRQRQSNTMKTLWSLVPKADD